MYFSYDVIFSGSPSQVVEAFKKLNCRVVFSAEAFCWPDKSLADEYPPVEKGKRFLNSGGEFLQDLAKLLVICHMFDCCILNVSTQNLKNTLKLCNSFFL